MAKRGRVKRCVAAMKARGYSGGRARSMCSRKAHKVGGACPPGYHIMKKGPGAGKECTKTVHRKE